jgi:hypothetical protein
MINLCPPAIIYLFFSLAQVLADTYNKMYNAAVIKAIFMVMITLLLNILCQSGLTIISWILVFIPFIFMSVIVTLTLYVFGLNATSGAVEKVCVPNKNVTVDPSGNIIIYNPQYDALNKPVVFHSPYLIVPNPVVKTQKAITTKRNPNVFIHHSTDPAFQM